MAKSSILRGVNLGNWLVLEKWMHPELFAGTIAEDETDLCQMLPPKELAARLKEHRDSYITREDFVFLASCGLNTLRLPVPHFVFDDCPPYVGCIEYVDKAFAWAQETGLQILIDLHTVPESQNGFDNGGICGVCKWHLSEINVQRTLDVLEKLAIRYKNHPALYGIQFVNEPISPEMFEGMQRQHRYPPRNPEWAKGSEGVPLEFLYPFYRRAYAVLRRHLDEDKALVFHDGFRLSAWKEFMRGPEYKNVVLDTHQYISFMFSDAQNPTLKDYMEAAFRVSRQVQEMRAFFPVIIGEWSVAHTPGKLGATALMDSSAVAAMARTQLHLWEQTDGWFFWSYKLIAERPGWDFRRMIEKDDFPRTFA